MWVRLGECKRCGRCCSLVNLLKAPVHASTVSNAGKDVRCKHLSMEGDAATCTIFGTDRRPPPCSLHPSSPESLTEDCGYFFVWVVR